VFSRRAGHFPEKKDLFIPPPQAAKVASIRRYARDFQMTTFIETGTYLGDTTAAVQGHFDRCITIELSDDLYRLALKRFASTPHVNCLHGDSGTVLSDVLFGLEGPAIFWLDAHHSGDGTASAGYDPIAKELQAIYSYPSNHVILVDDASGHAVDTIIANVPATHVASARNNIIRIIPRQHPTRAKRP
jgi:hypothetical protein